MTTFRAQRTDGHGWVEGLLFFSHGLGTYKITHSDGWVPTYSNPDEGESTIYTDVIASTIQIKTTKGEFKPINEVEIL